MPIGRLDHYSIRTLDVDATRRFYTAMGFRPLLESATFWDAENPCLLMGKVIGR